MLPCHHSQNKLALGIEETRKLTINQEVNEGGGKRGSGDRKRLSWKERGRKEGRKEGREKGRKGGKKEGREGGRKRRRKGGRQEGREGGRKQRREQREREGRKGGIERVNTDGRKKNFCVCHDKD